MLLVLSLFFITIMGYILFSLIVILVLMLFFAEKYNTVMRFPGPPPMGRAHPLELGSFT